jgi:hypothetical protein
MKNLALFAIPLVAHLLPGVSGYTWPDDKVDEVEDLLYLQTGYNARNFSGPITPCTAGIGTEGSILAAEWIRISFHDASAFNASTKTGGLDASIMWELKYKNNDGAGFNHTFDSMKSHYTMRSSMSDLFALGTYAAVRACGGLKIPIRAGRIDATEAYPIDGGPIPMDTAEKLSEVFSAMGFSVPDMVKLVACGHTMGGVHGGDLPPVLYNNSIGHFALFDSTGAGFDNKIITEFLDSTTQNPLVIGPETTNSDKHVFEFDGNVTVKSLVDPKVFQEACVDVFERMINSVPGFVNLSDVITPIAVKPDVYLQLDSTGSLVFAGTIRVHNTGVKDLTKTQKHTVTLSYVNDNMKAVNTVITTTHVGSGAGFDDSFEFYEFSHKLAAGGIHHFDVTVDGTKHNNNGTHYLIQDNILLQRSQSCISAEPDATGNYTIKVVSAVKNTASTSMPMKRMDMGTGPMLAIAHRIPQVANYSAVVPSLQMQDYNMTAMEAKFATNSGYSLYTSTQSLAADQVPTVFDIMTTTDALMFVKTAVLPACT